VFTWLARTLGGSRRRALLTVVGLIALTAILSVVAPKTSDVEDNKGTLDPPASAESVHAQAMLARAFPGHQGLPAIIVLRDPRGLTDTDFGHVPRITQALSGPGRPAGVQGAVSVASNPDAAPQLLSPDRTTTTIVVPVSGADPADEAFGVTVDKIREIAGAGTGSLQIRVTGPAGIIRDTVKVFSNADVVLMLVTMLLVLVLLLVIYRSLVLALLPLVTVGVAIGLTNALGSLLAKAGVLSFDANTGSIMTVLLFGVGTDYCLFLICRYREELSRTSDRYAAMAAAMRRVGEALVSSATIVVLALLALLVASLPVLRHFGPFLALGVLITLVVSLTLLPALVLLLDRIAFWPVRSAAKAPRSDSAWSRTAKLTLRRPVAVLAAGLVLLAMLSAGLLGYRENYNIITGFRAPTESAQGQKMLEAGFPAGSLGPTDILIDTGHLRAIDHLDAIHAVHHTIAAIPGVRSIDGPNPHAGAGETKRYLSADGHLARLQVVYNDDPYGAAALRRTSELRKDARAALDHTELRGGRVLVGGPSAQALDRRDANQHDLQLVVPIMLLLFALVLGVLLRSLLAPLILLASTVASVAAALGATVTILLTLGHGPGIGERVSIYVFLFLVALGVDYTIFLMARLREEARAHGHIDGIRRAVIHTGGVISSAGIILAGTFTVLMTQPIDPLYQFGLAMGIGLLLDTFLIRGILIPALLRLIGPTVWWPSRVTHPTENPQHDTHPAPDHADAAVTGGHQAVEAN
jgi:putative drug exporter of the RND superfamily